MEEIKLDVQIRKEVGRRSVKSVRQEDSVPAVVYGGDREPTNIKFDRRTYEKIRRQHQGESIVFHLNVCEGEKKLRDYSKHHQWITGLVQGTELFWRHFTAPVLELVSLWR